MVVTIALVDNDEDILDSVAMVLGIHGWRVVAYTSGVDFLADINRRSLDCLILEPHLPELDGAALVRTVAKDHAGLPIIALTARPVSQLTSDTMRAGAHALLTKPVTEETLVDCIQRAI